ncbi:enoyl-CoA hydratase-related protein [Pelomonas sp. KK5]|uniref:enoyl-CoA hydratase-related protein n=1 Tax=Pelomonas sp. KK5 TaxID=1855730 RepID=UPI0009F865B0|nr:enoyl-CoA hydratase-related protein [Pelomonas sp. KK5]
MKQDLTPETMPVIVGIGEVIDRPENLAEAREPLALMAAALQAADGDAGASLLKQAESLEVIAFISWRHRDPAAELCQRLGIQPGRQTNASVGGETPTRLIHEAALRISRGEQKVAAIVGGEAMNARSRARREKARLQWSEQVGKDEVVEFPNARFDMSPVARKLGMTDPAHVYPLYEMAAQAAWGQTPAEGQVESARLWEQYARVAATNPYAWNRKGLDAEAIAAVGDDNRLIAWPYPKLMVANPQVNQAAAVIVTSLAAARAAGVPEDRIVHVWGGALAQEPENYLQRDTYTHSTAQQAVLRRAVALVGGDARRFDRMELYSCFPVVPKMALRTLGLDAREHAPTVAGGLTFFGGPLNNYMGHAVCAMVRALRAGREEVGLLYGNGGYVNKHHTLVLSARPAASPLDEAWSAQADADAARGPVPELAEPGYQGPATVETYTIVYARDGKPLQGIVVALTADGRRTMARVLADDEDTMAMLLSATRSAVGSAGHIRVDTFGLPVWEAGALRDRSALPRRFCRVEREGHLTVVTITRPEVMNCLSPAANAELAEVFDAFERDPEQWVAILTGAGDKAFCTGNDLKFTATAMARGESIKPPLSGFAGLTSRFERSKPVIAAVNGLALGGGFEIALACDLIVAADTAQFALPEPKVGLAALAGGLLRLPRQIGLKPAMGMILTGRRVPAAEGQALGFVNQVTAPEDLMAEARRWAIEITQNSPMSIRASMAIVREGLDEPSLAEADVQQYRYPAARALFASEDFREGPRAFAEKRAPRWRGA